MSYATSGNGRRRGAAQRAGPGLQRRIMLYVALGSLLALVFFALVAQRAVQESSRIIFRERLHLAQLVASELAPWVEPGPDGHTLNLLSRAGLQATLTRFAATPQDGETNLRLTLMDHTGEVLLTTAPMSRHEHAEHTALLKDYLLAGGPGVATHEPDSHGHPHVVAFAALPDLPGGVMLEQHEDEALAVPGQLQSQMGFLGLTFVAIGLAAAWVTTRQVVGPLADLTTITRRIATGDLASPVPQKGQDEVCQLAVSFEAMRQQLQESHAGLARANQELERRVEARTRELEQRNAELAATSQRLQQRENERTFLLQKTIQAQEDERLRVARELHDAVGQFLSALVVRLSLLEDQAASCAPQVTAGLEELRTLTSRTVDDVRRLIVDLRPELLDDMGLPAALNWYAQAVLRPQGVDIALDVDSVQVRLPAEVEMVVFRVVQEAITNVLKHARARHVRIALHWQGGDLVGEAEDDGVGFALAGGGPAEPGAGVGLLGMRERVALLGGTLEINSTPGKGTHVAFRVPVARGEAG